MDNFTLNRGLERLTEIKPDFEYKKWFFSLTKYTQEVENKVFYKNSFIKYTIENFNPENIVGTNHTNYKNIMWIEMLGSLERYKLKNIETTEKVYSFINNETEMCLTKYGKEFYISEGNHRFCIAKFMNMNINKVFVVEYEFDNIYYKCWNYFKERKIEPISVNSNYWTVLMDTVELRINKDMIEPFIKYYDTVIMNKKWYNYFSTNQEESYNIRNENDFKNDSLIAKINQNKKRHTTAYLLYLG